jgi:hypothetical protein
MTARGRKQWGEYLEKKESLLKATEKHHAQVLAFAQAYPDDLADVIADTKKLNDIIQMYLGRLKQERSREGF